MVLKQWLIIMSKSLVREQYLKKRMNLNLELKEQYDRQILNNIINNLNYQNSDIIGCYYPIKNEFDCLLLIKQAWIDNKIVALVRMNSDKTLSFYQINSLADLVNDNKYQIYQPKNNNRIINLKAIDIIYMPLLAYNLRGYRLGYGQGYYDRTLIHYNNVIIGLGYSFQEEKIIKYQSHDQKCNLIINEKGIIHL